MNGISDFLTVMHLSSQSGWRGGEQQIAYLLEEMREKGIGQLVLCPSGSEMETFCRENDYAFELFRPAGSFSLRAAGRIRTSAQLHEIVLLHAHDSHSLNHAVLANRLFRVKLPVVVNRRVDFPVKSVWKYRHHSVKRIICDSDNIRRVMRRCLGGEEKLLTIHSGIDVRRFSGSRNRGVLRRQYHVPDEELLVGNVAAIADQKDYFTFVDAAELLSGRIDGLRFLVIGDGPDREKIEKYIARKKLTNRFIFTGFRRDIPDILPELDCFLMTSKTEGLGTVIIEAFASGVPVAATAAGGIPEIVTHGETGMLSPVGDAQSLAESVHAILRDEELRRRLVENASRVPQRFDKKEIARKTIEVYREVVDSQPIMTSSSG